MRLTKQRIIILKLIQDSIVPLNCEMIHRKLENQSINLSTVYRTVDKLLENKVINKHYFNNIAYYTYNDGCHKHYLYCTECKQAFAFDCPFDNSLTKEKLRGFKVNDHEITVYGKCPDCSGIN